MPNAKPSQEATEHVSVAEEAEEIDIIDVEAAIDKVTNKLDLRKFLIKVQGGRSYLPVQARIIAFRHVYPHWGVFTEAMEINHEKQYAVFRTTIYDLEGRVVSTGTKKEDVKGFGDYIEKAETGSLGRALNVLGFGTEYATDLNTEQSEVTQRQADQGQGRYADSPQRTSNGGNNGGGYNGQNQGRYGGNNGGGGNGARERSGGQGEARMDAGGHRGNDGGGEDERYEDSVAHTTTNQSGGGLSGKTPEARAVQSAQIKIREQRERVWGERTTESEAWYRAWLERQIGETSLKNSPIEVTRKALALLQSLPVNDPFDERFIEDQSEVAALPTKKAVAA